MKKTFENDLIRSMGNASEGNLSQFTSSVRNIARRLELPSTQLISQWKSHFPMWRWCNVLSLVISQDYFTAEEGRTDMLTASLLETIISAGSIVHPTPRLAVRYLYRVWGIVVCVCVGAWSCNQGKFKQRTQSRWMIACCVRHSATHLLPDAVSEEDQRADAVFKWWRQLQSAYWRSSVLVQLYRTLCSDLCSTKLTNV